MLEDQDTRQRWNKALREKAEAGSGETKDMVVTDGFPMTREKENVSGCS